ncbi:MAG: MMPL family transporter [Candidatus Bathyarchaeia archaeon]|jgi:RND superfamily putative drug exporter
MKTEKVNFFGKIGQLILKRKYVVIFTWLLLLVLIVPFALSVTGVISLQMGASSDSNLESVKADDLIGEYFSSSVANDSLVIVVSTNNASSIETQRFLEQLSNKIKSDPDITSVQNVTNVYTILVPALNQTNEGAYTIYTNANMTYSMLYGVPVMYKTVWETAYEQTQTELSNGLSQLNPNVYMVYDNANMTYNLLYGVPTMYTMVWSTAYNQTQTQLADGLNQTSQGVYTVFNNANMTLNLLYGVPATYLNVWSQAYTQTQNVDMANQVAYNQTAQILYQADPASFEMYASPLLDAFYNGWVQSFQNPATQTLTPVKRASTVSSQTTQMYINTFLAGNQTAQQFTTALTSAITFDQFLQSNQTQYTSALTGFSVQTVVAQSGQSAEFVTAAYNLGPNPSSNALTATADAVILNPASYNMDQNFIPMFNEIAYNQTAIMMQQLDPASYAMYTKPLLDAFNATWTTSFQNPATQSLTPVQRASAATDQTVQLYINNFLAGNQSAIDFANALTSTLKLENFLYNTPEQNAAALQDFSVRYIANQSSDITVEFVNAAFNLGRNPSKSAIDALTNDIIWGIHDYGMDDFIDMFNDISYEQSVKILKDADQAAFDQYTSHLLDIFDASWTHTFSNVSMNDYTATERALAITTQATSQFVNSYLNDNSTINDFATMLTNTFSLNDFLNNNQTQNNNKLYNFTITYLAGQSGLSEDLVKTIYDLGENPTEEQLRDVAGDIVYNPAAYNVGQEFDTLVSSFVSPNKDVTIISVDFTDSSEANLLAIRDHIKTVLEQNPTVESALVTGTDALNYDFNVSTMADLELILPVTIVLLLVATGLFFRSIVTPLITLGTIGVGLGISQIFLYLVGTYVNNVDFMIPTILLTVLIGVGTDYSIFIIARHREERVNGLPLHKAIIQSVTWAGESITTSGATVIISFLSLAITSIVLMQTMGLVVGLGVIVMLAVSLTFAPALTAILGDRIFWPNTGERFQNYAESVRKKSEFKNGYFAKSGNFSVKHAKVVVLIAVLVTVPTFYVYATTVPTYDFLGGASDTLESIQASHTLTDSFGGGKLFPSYVVVTFDHPIVQDGVFNQDEMAKIQQMSSQIASHADVQEVSSPTMPYDVPIDYQSINSTSDENTFNSIMSSIGSDNKSALITLRFSVDPYSTPAMNAAQDMRTSLHENFDNTNGVTGIYLGGTTGGILDTKNVFVDQFNVILPIVAVGVTLVLFFVLGSLILPLFALVSVLMSIVWTLAVTAVVFQSAFNYGLLFMTPLILFVLLLGLGMDYNIFILTRIREEAAKGENLKTAIVHSIEQTGGIITAAAVILAGSLGALMLSSNLLLVEMGFAFSFSILIDALVVRTYLVPAVMSMLGKWNWYNPIKRLQRIKTDNNKNGKQ